ncbi:MAG: DUF5686 family protein [Bacteroidota bacterium]|nr:DUF5686 family protein [Bacteroidota bacterium]
MTACSRLSEPHSRLSYRRSVLRWLLVALSVVVFLPLTQCALGQVLVTGSVRDSDTLLPLVSAHVILDGAVQGTITNRDGAFEITLPDLPATLIFRHIGYNSVQVTLGPDDPRVINVSLETAAIPLPEVLVTGDNLAAGIMERVIHRKLARRAHLESYGARMYSRITLRHRERIVLISETVLDRFATSQAGTRDIVRSMRSTSDFYEQLGLTPAPQDFSSDYVQINGLIFFGPTHPDALDHYNFTLAGRRRWGDQQLYDIYLAPKNNQEATLIGRISVLDSVYALAEVDVRPASHVVFQPDTRAWRVAYRQSFAPADSFWLPIDLRMEGRIHVEPEGEATSPTAVQQVARLMNYQINQAVPTAPFTRQEQLQVDSVSVFRDDLFLMGLDMVALTAQELDAIDDLLRARPLTLRQALPATASVRGSEMEARSFHLGDRPQFVWPLIGGFAPWLRYNRVDGTLVGVGKAFPIGERTELAARIGKSLVYDYTRVAAGLRNQLTSVLGTSVIFERDVQPQNGTLIHTEATNSLSARLLARDYFDWYWATRVRLNASYEAHGIRAKISGMYAVIDSVQTQVRRPWPHKREFPTNSLISPGHHKSFELRVAAGSDWQPYRIDPQERVEVRVEYGDAPQNRRYLKATLLADGYMRTLMRRRPQSAGMSVRVLAGFSTSRAPVEQWHVAEGSMGPIGTLGTLRTVRNRRIIGRHVAGIHWEHDFRSLLFELFRVRPLVDQKVSSRFGAAHVYVNDGWIHEITLSIARAPLRVDLSRRINQPGLFVSIGLAGRR